MIKDSRLKKNLIRVLLLVILLPTPYFLLAHEALAICPVCTVAVGAGLEISHLLGVDDAVTSVWIGGLILSMSYWMVDWIKKKIPRYKDIGSDKKRRLLNILISDLFMSSIMYIIVLVPLWYGKYIGRLANGLFGVDKIVFGVIVGSAAFLFGKWMDQKVRQVKGKQLFNYQRVVFPVSALILTSLVLYFVTR